MNERIIEINNLKAHLNIDRGFMVLSVEGEEFQKIAFDEISAVIANSYQLTFSNSLLIRLSELNIPLIICGANQSPMSYLWSTDSNSRLSARIESQISATKIISKQSWQAIIKAKIYNQMIVLKKLEKKYIFLSNLIEKVRSGDTTNIEAQAAKIYWRELMGDDFKRDRDLDDANKFFNYGYTIIRSRVARAIMGTGFHPSIGVFHKNQFNPFRLVDDLLEPFRPVVDYKVYNLWQSGKRELDKDVKRELVSILYMDIDYGDETSTVYMMTEYLLKSYARSLESLKISLDLPILRLETL